MLTGAGMLCGEVLPTKPPPCPDPRSVKKATVDVVASQSTGHWTFRQPSYIEITLVVKVL